LVGLGLNSELHTCKAGTLLLEPHLQSIFSLVILEIGLSGTICPDWSWAVILLISPSQKSGLQVWTTSSWLQFSIFLLKTFTHYRFQDKSSVHSFSNEFYLNLANCHCMSKVMLIIFLFYFNSRILKFSSFLWWFTDYSKVYIVQSPCVCIFYAISFFDF
jgi:hypothetical protein